MSDDPDDGAPARGGTDAPADAPAGVLADRPRLAVVALAVSVRLLAAAAWTRPPQGLADPWLYQRFARGIAAGQGYVTFRGTPTSYYPPGYPFFLGGLRWLLDRFDAGSHLPMAAAAAQSLLAGVTAWALVGIGDRIDPVPGPSGATASTGTRRWRAGVAAALVFALWPNLVVHSTVLLSENLYVPFFACFLLATVRALQTPAGAVGRARWSMPVTAGVFLGAAALVRPQVLVVAVGLAAAALLVQRPWRQRVGLVLAPLVVAGVVVVPWTIRNAGVFDRFVAVSTNGGDNVCVGFHDGATGHFEIPPVCQTGEFYIDGPRAEVRRNAETARLAGEWARRNIGALPVLSLKKLWYTYESDHDGLRALESYENDLFLAEATRSLLRGLSDTAYLVIMIGVVAGAAIAARRVWRRRRTDDRDVTTAALAFVLVATAASAAVPVLVFGDPRFKVPATPGLAVLAGIAIVAALRPISGQPALERPRPEPVPAP